MTDRGEVFLGKTRAEQLEHVKISNKLFTFGKRFVGWGVGGVWWMVQIPLRTVRSGDHSRFLRQSYQKNSQ